MIPPQLSRALGTAAVTLALFACQTPPPQPVSEGHLSTQQAPPPVADIPAPVQQVPFVPPPRPRAPAETYTVVVSEVPVKELLFALARDADINIDVHPAINGNVTLNAIDQTLDQILDRIARQVPLRYEEQNDTLAIVPDTPFLKTYRVDYVNVTRVAESEIAATSSLEGGGESGVRNTSSTDIESATTNDFWGTLKASLDEIVAASAGAPGAGQERVLINRDGGLVLVRATQAQHRQVQSYIDELMVSVNRQVLIEATIVEVALNDRYQGGIDWRVFTRQGGLTGAGITFGSDLADAFVRSANGGVAGLVFSASDAPLGSAKRDIEASINLLNEFGDTQVLSSPKVMALNNQPAILKVVDNEVYFEITTELSPGDINNNATVSFDTDIRTVSVGLVMNVTPQISGDDQVMLSVRPTITRIGRFVDDPAVPVALAQAGIQNVNVANSVPVVQVRESESVMRVGSGQLAILGGLMEDSKTRNDQAVPGLSSPPGIGELFKFRDRAQRKTELVVFLRPTVIRSPSLDADLSSFRRMLPENLDSSTRRVSPLDEPYQEQPQ